MFALHLLHTEQYEEIYGGRKLGCTRARLARRPRMKRYMVDSHRSVAFDSLEDAKLFARNNFPAVIMERTTDERGRVGWREIMRFDWHWNEERGEAVIELW